MKKDYENPYDFLAERLKKDNESFLHDIESEQYQDEKELKNET